RQLARARPLAAGGVPAPVLTRQQGSGMKLKVALILVFVVAGTGAVFVSMGGLPARGATPHHLTANAATADVSDDVAATGAVESTANYGLAFGAPAHLFHASARSRGARTAR